MDGLECSEVMISQVRQYAPFRIDSHFYEKQYEKLKLTLSHFRSASLKELVKKPIQTGHTPSMAVSSYYGGSIALIKTDNLHDNSISTVFSDYLTVEGNAVISRTELAEKDIITTIIGATEHVIARSAIVTLEYLPSNINQNIVQIRINCEKIAPEFVNIYLNTKYGKGYLVFLSRQTEQYNLNCREIEMVPIPLLSDNFQKEIVRVVLDAQKYQNNSRMQYKNAESILSELIDIHTSLQNQPNFSVRKISKSFVQTGRLDAEYYQSKYEAIVKKLNTRETVLSLCNLHDKNYNPDAKQTYQYIELADVGQSGDISDVDIQYGSDLPTRARRIVKSGQVIVPSVEGSLQSCALITDEYDGVLCSTGFYVLDSDCINSETLLVLFKSEPIQALMKQRCSGTILTAISKDELLSMPLPMIDDDIQEKIAAKVQESFALRKQSKQLLEYAKQAVEMAIEQGEDVALAWLKDKIPVEV
mgnify:FL=1